MAIKKFSVNPQHYKAKNLQGSKNLAGVF